MNANYAEIYRVGNLEADFQQALRFSQYCCETSKIQILERKVKTIFLDKKFQKKSLYYRNCIGQTNVWP